MLNQVKRVRSEDREELDEVSKQSFLGKLTQFQCQCVVLATYRIERNNQDG